MTRPGPELRSGPPPLRADDPVDRIAGIGPKSAAALAAVGVRRVSDLLFHLPRRYEDRGQVVAVGDAAGAGRPVLLYGRLAVRSSRYVRRRLHITDGELADASGRLRVRWFNQPWIAERLEGGVEAFAFGAVGLDRGGRAQLVNPEIEIVPRSARIDEVVPVYPRLGPLTGKRLRKVMDQALGCLDGLTDPVPGSVRRDAALVGLAEALGDLHRPRLPGDPDRRRRRVAELNDRATAGHLRLAFDELLAVATVVAGTRARRLEQSATPMCVARGFERRCRALLPFELTAAQRRAIGEITADLGRPVPMARLLQGDVGSGKTAVAVLAIAAVLESGRQAALMAPTELLAEQLHRSVAAALEPIGARVCLLTGSVPAAAAGDLRSRLAAGEIDVVVGTHALFQEKVEYADLGLVVIDEQHRFGVAQRQRLLDKGESPHLLVMTATPIPRSLALTLYGDLDLTVIDELPPGRSPVRTEIRGIDARDRILAFLRDEIAAGGQVFIVFPLIEASDKVTAAALEEEEARIRRGLGGLEVGVLHGRLTRDDRELVAARFRRGELRVVLATTVIEVGVDVPAASVMVVESADRFGLSQLHQLRGRVGRGARRSWCILVAGDGASEAAMRRLAVLGRTTDGFEIAEADLEHRGPGEITGRRQWGAEAFRFADLLRHRDLVVRTQTAARELAAAGTLDEVRDALLRHHRIGEDFSVG